MEILEIKPHTNVHTQAHAHIHKHVYIHTSTHTNTYAYTYTHAQADRQIDRQADACTDTHTYTHAQTHTQNTPHTFIRNLPLSWRLAPFNRSACVIKGLSPSRDTAMLNADRIAFLIKPPVSS